MRQFLSFTTALIGTLVAAPLAAQQAQSHNGGAHQSETGVAVPNFQGRPTTMPQHGAPQFRGDNLGDHIAVKNLNISNYKIINLGDPSAPTDGVNLRTVETLVAGARDNMGDQIARNGPVYLNGFALMTGNRMIDPVTGDLTVENGMTIIGQHIYDAHVIRGLILPVDGTDATNKNYVDGRITEVIGGIPEIEAGDGISVTVTGRQHLISVNSTVVRTTGDQTIGGVKTFTLVPKSEQDPVVGNDLVRLSYVEANFLGVNNQNLVISQTYTNRPVATGTHTMAAGTGSSAAVQHSIALGSAAQASEQHTIAIGRSAAASGSHAMAIGRDATATQGQSIAIGRNASATGGNSVALGYRSSAIGGSSVAIGIDSVAHQASTFSVGRDASQGTAVYRRIVNVNDPVGQYDAVNRRFLEAALAGMGADNLGNHIATESLKMSGFAIENANRLVIGGSTADAAAMTIGYIGTLGTSAAAIQQFDSSRVLGWTLTKADAGANVTEVLSALGANNYVTAYGSKILTVANMREQGILVSHARAGTASEMSYALGGQTGAANSTIFTAYAEHENSAGFLARVSTLNAYGLYVNSRQAAKRGIYVVQQNQTTDPDAPAIGIHSTVMDTAANNASALGGAFSTVDQTGLRLIAHNTGVDYAVFETNPGMPNDPANIVNAEIGRIFRDGNSLLMHMNNGTISGLALPTANSHAANKEYVDQQITATTNPYTEGDGIAINAATRVISVNNTVVRTSGAQTIADLKTFNTAPRAGTDPVNGNDLVRLSYLNTVIGGIETITGGDGITVTGGVVAVNNTVVRTTGNQTIGGVKTFSARPVMSAGLTVASNINLTGTTTSVTGLTAPTANTDAANKKYVDDQRDAAIAASVYTGANGVTVNATTRVISVDATFLRTTGDQAGIAGIKTFNVPPRASADPTNNNDLVRLSYLTAQLGNYVTINTAQTITGAKTFSQPIIVTNTFDVNGTAPSAQRNGLYVADLGAAAGSTLNPTNTAAIVAQINNNRSIAFSVDSGGYLYGFRSHTGAGTYTWQSKVRLAAALETARTINGVSFNGTANITLPTVNMTGDQSGIAGIKTFNVPPRTLADPTNGNDVVRLSYLNSRLTAGGADNLGNHIATEALKMSNFGIENANRVIIGAATPAQSAMTLGYLGTLGTTNGVALQQIDTTRVIGWTLAKATSGSNLVEMISARSNQDYITAYGSKVLTLVNISEQGVIVSNNRPGTASNPTYALGGVTGAAYSTIYTAYVESDNSMGFLARNQNAGSYGYYGLVRNNAKRGIYVVQQNQTTDAATPAMGIYSLADTTAATNASAFGGGIGAAGQTVARLTTYSAGLEYMSFERNTAAPNTNTTNTQLGRIFRVDNSLQMHMNNGVISGLVLPTADSHAANKEYVDQRIAATSGAYTGSNGITVNATTRVISVDATFLRTTGDQTGIAGIKTFNVPPRASADPTNNNDLVRLSYLNSGFVTIGTTQTITGAKTFSQPIMVTGTFDTAGTGAGAQPNGLYMANLGGAGTTLNPANTVGIMAQISSARSIGVSVDGSGYLYGFRSHSNAGTYTWQSKVRLAAALETARTINGVSFNGTANITLPTVNMTGDQSGIAGIKTFNVPPRASADPTNNNDLVRLSYLNTRFGNFVTLDTTQTISALKTFSLAPRSSVDPTNNNDLVRLSFINGNFVRLTTDQSVAGIKTFSSAPRSTVDPSNNNDLIRLSYANNNFVRLTTNQTVAGIKTFTDQFRSNDIRNHGNLAMNIEALGNYMNLTSAWAMTFRGGSFNMQTTQGVTHIFSGGAESTFGHRGLELFATGAIRMESGRSNGAAGAVDPNLAAIGIVSGGRLDLQTSGGHTLRLQSGGPTEINAGSVVIQSRTTGAIHMYGGGWTNIHSGYGGGTGNIRFYTQDVHRYTINASGGANASDIRLKDNIINVENGLEMVRQMRAVSYDWKDIDERSYGVIAQELREIMPEAVVEDPETGMLSVNYTQIISPMIDAVQTLDQRNQDLEAENAALKTSIAEILQRLEAVEAKTAE